MHANSPPRARIRPHVTGSMLLCLVLLGAGCASDPTVLTVTRVDQAFPPASLLIDTPAPRPQGVTGYALIQYSQALEAALGACNADKASLREWVRGGK